MAADKWLSIISLNVRQIKSKPCRAAILDYLRNLHADIYCLQECGIVDSLGDQDWPYGEHLWSGSATNKMWDGVLMGSKNLKIESYVVVEIGWWGWW